MQFAYNWQGLYSFGDLKSLCQTCCTYPHHVRILVVCPLKSLVDFHICELQNRGISVASLSSEGVVLQFCLKFFTGTSFNDNSGVN